MSSHRPSEYLRYLYNQVNFLTVFNIVKPLFEMLFEAVIFMSILKLHPLPYLIDPEVQLLLPGLHNGSILHILLCSQLLILSLKLFQLFFNMFFGLFVRIVLQIFNL